MSKGNTFENQFLALIFNATAMADLAEDDSSSPATVLEVSLHTADPGEAGGQSSNEATYTDYARIPVARTNAGWTVVNNSVSNAVAITFPACNGGTNTITHFAVGTAHSGAGKLLYSGELGTPLSVSQNIIPTFPIGELSIEED
jgi:hypothetical protein